MAAAFLLAAGAMGAGAVEAAPNVILIVADDLGYGDLSGVDGRAVSAWWRGESTAEVEEKPFFHFWERDPDAIGQGGQRGEVGKVFRAEALYDVVADPGETRDMAAEEPERVLELKRLAQQSPLAL